MTDDGLYAWGGNRHGRVGSGSTDESVRAPQKIMDNSVKEIVAGITVYAITDVGLYAWGDNECGQVGSGSSDKIVLAPQKVMNNNVKKVIREYGTVYVITDDGLYAWGDNEDGQVGNGSSDKVVITPQKIMNGYVKIVIGYSRVYAITDDGIYAWGDDLSGQLGKGVSDKAVRTPQKILDGYIKEIINISYCDACYSTAYAITDTGLYAWGSNEYGYAGNGGLTYETILIPKKILDDHIKEIVIVDGKYIVWNEPLIYAITSTGLYTWGLNSYGKDKGCTDKIKLVPKKIIDGCVKKIVSDDNYDRDDRDSYDHTIYAITDDGLYAWGNNKYGQVGKGTVSDNVSRPVKIKFH